MWTTTSSNSEMNGGGIADLLCTDSKTINVTRLCMDCVAARKFEFLDFLLMYRFTPDLSYTDTQGNNILHGLVVAANKCPNAKRALYQILSNLSCKDALNHQNVNGDTPLHFAVLEGLNEIVTLFLSKGAKKKKNNKGLLVMTEIEQFPEVKCNKQDIFVPSRSNKILRPKRVERSLSDSTEKLLSALVSYFPNVQENASQMSFSATSEPNKKENNKRDVENLVSQMSFSATSERPKEKVLSGGCGCEKQNENKIIGGKKLSKITGHRKMATYSEIEYGNMLGESSSNAANTTSELTHNFRNQTDKFHEETIAKIMEVLGSKADIILARALKALLYNEVKTSRQELNGLDRAVEMLHRVTDEKIKQLMRDKSDLLNDIMNHLKSKNTTESDGSKKTKAKAKKAPKESTKKAKTKDDKKSTAKKSKKMSRHVVSSASELSSVSLDSFI